MRFGSATVPAPVNLEAVLFKGLGVGHVRLLKRSAHPPAWSASMKMIFGTSCGKSTSALVESAGRAPCFGEALAMQARSPTSKNRILYAHISRCFSPRHHGRFSDSPISGRGIECCKCYLIAFAGRHALWVEPRRPLVCDEVVLEVVPSRMFTPIHP